MVSELVRGTLLASSMRSKYVFLTLDSCRLRLNTRAEGVSDAAGATSLQLNTIQSQSNSFDGFVAFILVYFIYCEICPFAAWRYETVIRLTYF